MVVEATISRDLAGVPSFLVQLPSPAYAPLLSWSVTTVRERFNGAGQAVGPTGDDIAYGNGIAADGSGNVYITGFFRGAITFGSLPAITSSNLAAFQAKLNAGGVITATTQRAAALILAVHPNPASDGSTVSIPVAGGGELELVDLKGSTLRKQIVPMGAGNGSFSLVGVLPGIVQLRFTLRTGQVARRSWSCSRNNSPWYLRI